MDRSNGINPTLSENRDLKLDPLYTQQKPGFFKPSLENYDPRRFVSPLIMKDLVDILERQHIIALSGGQGIDLSALARHLAWYFIKANSTHGAMENPSVKEWFTSSDPQNIYVTLQEELDESLVVILPGILPQHVAHDIRRIHTAAFTSKHYVILTTNKSFEAWKLSGLEAAFWFDLTDKELYNEEDLIEHFHQKTEGVKNFLPATLSSLTLDPNQPIFGSLSIRQIACKLKTLDNITTFIQQLVRSNKSDIREHEVQELIATVLDDSKKIDLWFHHQLTRREQLLALGMNMFDGLFDDQFFGALERVVDSVWRQRHPLLESFDYCDLDNLNSFFSQVETKDGGIKVESRVDGQRAKLFDRAWNSHRRQILATLPALVQIVKQSGNFNEFNVELYGTLARREQLRLTISETLSDIGLQSVACVEELLLQLAASSSSEVQVVAAHAMARWRNYSADTKLFSTLDRWQKEARFIDLVNELLQADDEKETEGLAYIRATVALTVGFAALHDKPNELAAELCTLLKDLSHDPHSW